MTLSKEFIVENTEKELLAQERYNDCKAIYLSMGFKEEDCHKFYSIFYNLWQLTQGCKRQQGQLQEFFEPLPDLFVREFLEEATDVVEAWGKSEIPLMYKAFLEKIQELRG